MTWVISAYTYAVIRNQKHAKLYPLHHRFAISPTQITSGDRGDTVTTKFFA